MACRNPRKSLLFAPLSVLAAVLPSAVGASRVSAIGAIGAAFTTPPTQDGSGSLTTSSSFANSSNGFNYTDNLTYTSGATDATKSIHVTWAITDGPLSVTAGPEVLTGTLSGTVTVPASGSITSITSSGSFVYNGTTTLGTNNVSVGPFLTSTGFNASNNSAQFTVPATGSATLLENGVATLIPSASGQVFVIHLPAGETFATPEPASLGLVGLGGLVLLGRRRRLA